MDRSLCIYFVYIFVFLSPVLSDRSDDCNTVLLLTAEETRQTLHVFMEKSLKTFAPTREALTSVCGAYRVWEEAMDPIYDDCQHYASATGFSHENYTRTVAIYDYICDDITNYETHQVCLQKSDVQSGLQVCFDTFWGKYQAEINAVNVDPMSTVHDRGCDYLNDAIACVRNISSSGAQCSEADVDYYEDFFRGYVKPWMSAWNCQFDRSWGWIITTGMLVALLAVVAVVWAACFLCCRYCCTCCGGGGGKRRRRGSYGDSEEDVHPMERY